MSFFSQDNLDVLYSRDNIQGLLRVPCRRRQSHQSARPHRVHGCQLLRRRHREFGRRAGHARPHETRAGQARPRRRRHRRYRPHHALPAREPFDPSAPESQARFAARKTREKHRQGPRRLPRLGHPRSLCRRLRPRRCRHLSKFAVYRRRQGLIGGKKRRQEEVPQTHRRV